MLTPAQRLKRSSGIGSSDVAAVLGIDPYRSAADVLARKLDPALEVAENMAMRFGTLAESLVAECYTERTGIALVEPPDTYVHLAIPCLIANVDRRHAPGGAGAPIVECKTHGSRAAAQWGEDGEPVVPDAYLVQVLHQVVVTGAEAAEIARLNRDTLELGVHQIALDDNAKRIMETIVRVVPAWWHRHVVDRDPLPAGALPPSPEVLRAVRRVPGKAVSIPTELVVEWRRLHAEATRADEAADLARGRVLAALGDAEEGVDGAGEPLVSYRANKASKVLDGKALQRECPEVYARFLVERAGARVLRAAKHPALAGQEVGHVG